MMDRNVDRRTGMERRRREELYLPWQEAHWAPGWDGTERRAFERRADADRSHRVARADQVPWYSDDWARARGARNMCDWLDRCSRQPSIGLPGGRTSAA